MTKLATLLEKIENLKLEKIITDLTINTNKDVIDEFVMSKKKDDRIAIAANPNLTGAHFEKLSNDKVNAVKQALCYNKNISSKYAKQLLDEEPFRLEFIASYAGDQIDDTLIDYLTPKAAKDRYSQEAILRWLALKPTVSKKLYKWVNDNIAMDRIGFSKEFQRRTDAPKDIIITIVKNMIKENANNYGGVTRILINHPAFNNEVLLSLDPSNNGVQEAILYSGESTKKMVLDVINNMNQHTSGRVLSEGGSKWAKDKDILNAYLEMTIKSDDIASYTLDLSILRQASNIGLNPDLLVQAAKLFAPKIGNNNSSGLEAFILNVNYPEDQLDFIPINEHTIKAIISSPNISIDKIEKIIDMYPAGREIEQIMWGIASGHKGRDLPNELQQKLRDKLKSKYFFFEYIARGDMADNILNNPEKYMDDLNTEYSSSPSTELDIIVRLSSNTSISSNQKDKILAQYEKFKSQSKYTINPIGNIVGQTTNTPEYLEKLFKQDSNNVWFIWAQQNSTYFQYNEFQHKIIDKYILKTKECPDNMVFGIFNLNMETFKEWIDYSSKNGNGIDDKMALKYLIHFLSIADKSPKLKEYLVDDKYVDYYLGNESVKNGMYSLTKNEKYLSDEVKDVFLF